MREFFQGRKRKAGCAMLALACLAVAGWTRSAMIVDNLYYRVDQLHGLGLLSQDQCMGFIVKTHDSPLGFPASLYAYDQPDFETVNSFVSQYGGWRFHLMGFGYFCKSFSEFRTLRGWFIPYWSIVIPLTLLSAWLLLPMCQRWRHS